MTTNTSINAASVGTGANVGYGISPAKVTIASTTSAFVVTGRVTNGAGGYDQSSRIRLWYASSPVSLAAADAPSQLKTSARYLELIPEATAGKASIRASEPETCAGSYIYLWAEVPAVSVAQTLDGYIVELP